MNLAALIMVGGLSWLNYSWHRHNEEAAMEMAGGGMLKKAAAWTALAALTIGIIIHLFLPTS
jgi:hypothetical protein